MADNSRPGSERLFLSCVVLGGIIIRLVWLIQVHGSADTFLNAAEATNVALSFARTGTIADAYFPGQGPTAHLLPLNPMISGLIMRLFGPGTTAANYALLGWSLAQVGCAYLLLRKLFQELGADVATVRWGTALLFLVTPFVPQEVVDFRYWEGGSALALGALNLLLIARLDRQKAAGWRLIAVIATLSALTFFVSPSVGLAVDLCWAIVALRRLPFAQCVKLATASACALAVFVVPWALRNDRVLGAPVLLRSNFGLELALANHPAALSTRPPEYVFSDWIKHFSPPSNARVQAILRQKGGEVGYAHEQERRTWRWIAAHPTGFARLWLRHLRQFFFPEAWQMYFTGWEGMREARALTISAVGLFGLVGLALGLLRRQRGYWMLAVYIAAIAIPFALFQPMSRYIFLAYGPLAFLAVDALVQALRRARTLVLGHTRDHLRDERS